MTSTGVKNLFPTENNYLAGKPIVNHTMWDMYPKPSYKMRFLRGYCYWQVRCVLFLLLKEKLELNR